MTNKEKYTGVAIGIIIGAIIGLLMNHAMIKRNNDYVKFLESDNMMLRKGIMLEYEDLHK